MSECYPDNVWDVTASPEPCPHHWRVALPVTTSHCLHHQLSRMSWWNSIWECISCSFGAYHNAQYLVKVITIINSQQLLKRGSFKMNQNKLILITQKVNTFTMNKWLEPLDSHIFPISQSIRFNKIINLKSLILRIFLIFSLWTAESTVKSPVSSLKQNHEYHRRDDDEALTWHCSLQ